MKILSLAIFFISFTSFSQINFEPGYFISENDVKTTCLIKNVNWKNNPTSFEYKSAEDTDSESLAISNVKEFGFTVGSRYIRHQVDIDRSSDVTQNLDNKRTPNYTNEQLFLKILVDGDAKLYYYEDGNLRRFFYTVEQKGVEQLVYKRFRSYQTKGDQLDQLNKIKVNHGFRQQLLNDLQCADVKKVSIAKMRYKADPMIALFNQYNSCKNSNFVISKINQKPLNLGLTLRPGLKAASLSVEHANNVLNNVDFDKKLGLRLGLELEVTLPFNNDKWNLILEPTFQSYKVENLSERKVAVPSIYNFIRSVDYKSIELPLGVRYKMFLSANSILYFNPLVVVDFPINSEFKSGGFFPSTLSLETNVNFAIGFGFKYHRLSLEARYQTPREVFGNESSVSYKSSYEGYSIIIGYSIF